MKSMRVDRVPTTSAESEGVNTKLASKSSKRRCGSQTTWQMGGETSLKLRQAMESTVLFCSHAAVVEPNATGEHIEAVGVSVAGVESFPQLHSRGRKHG